MQDALTPQGQQRDTFSCLEEHQSAGGPRGEGRWPCPLHMLKMLLLQKQQKEGVCTI